MKPTNFRQPESGLRRIVFHSKRWLGLPYRLHNWLLQTATRVITFTSAAGMLGYSLVFSLNGARLTSLPLYYKFAALPQPVVAGVFVALGVAQLVLMVWDSPRGNILGGFVLVVSALVWMLVLAAFDAARPPANTGMVFPAIMAFLCATAGSRLIDISKRLKQER